MRRLTRGRPRRTSRRACSRMTTSRASRTSASRSGETQDRVNRPSPTSTRRTRTRSGRTTTRSRHHQKTTQAEDDAAEEARYRQDLDKKQARTDAKAKRKKSLSDVLSESGDEGMKNASRIDTSYHGGGGYVLRSSSQIAGARAMGGLISPGLCTHRTAPSRRGDADARPALAQARDLPRGNSTALAAKTSRRAVKAMSDFATKYTKSPAPARPATVARAKMVAPSKGRRRRQPTPTGHPGRSRAAGEKTTSAASIIVTTSAPMRATTPAEERARDLAYAGGAGGAIPPWAP